MLFQKEHARLSGKMITPLVFVDKAALVTLPFDMLINQMIETKRGDGKHGSCGLGINETFTRNENYALFNVNMLYNLVSKKWLNKYLIDILTTYVPKRLAELGLNEPDDPMYTLLHDENIRKQYIEAAEHFIKHIILVDGPEFLHAYDNLIFEGSQGLELDEKFGPFPHVTRGRVGSLNAHKILDEIGFTVDNIKITTVYLTRAYATRHGNGPLQHEMNTRQVPYFNDETNKYNRFQGHLRVGVLDPLHLKSFIDKDTAEVNKRHRRILVVNCLRR